MNIDDIFYEQDYQSAVDFISVNENTTIQEIDADENGRRFQIVAVIPYEETEVYKTACQTATTYNTWYNETYIPQCKELLLNFLKNEAKHIRERTSADELFYKHTPTGIVEYNEISALQDEFRQKLYALQSLKDECHIEISEWTQLGWHGYNNAEYQYNNPILDLNEIVQDYTSLAIKVGDGVTAFNDLPFYYEYVPETTEETPTEETTTTEGGE
jgi:hypothetical protein